MHAFRLILLVAVLSAGCVRPVFGAYGKGTVTINVPGVPSNLPKNIFKSEPKLEDYNALFKDFFEADFFGTSDADSCAKLAVLFQAETSNSLYAKLKAREKRFDGSVVVQPIQTNDEQIIFVSARICYTYKLIGTHRYLRSENYHIVFSKKGVFKEVRRLMTFEQEL